MDCALDLVDRLEELSSSETERTVYAAGKDYATPPNLLPQSRARNRWTRYLCSDSRA